MSRRGTEWFARAVTAAQKSAEGIVVAGATKARTMEGSKGGELMRAERQNNQLVLAFSKRSEGEARSGACEGTEVCVARADTERPATGPTMEEVLEPGNLRKALERVRRNKGAPGVDGMTVKELGDYLKEQWPGIRAQLLEGRYSPQPVRRVEIPKAGGGMRPLGVPTVLDRFIQQAVGQVLGKRWDSSFSESSYGFRPGRSAHQAVRRAQEHIRAGCRIVVDVDLEKFFDRVNHDILMGLVSRRVEDKRTLKLLRGYLNSGVLEGGLVSPTVMGVPQGGPLSPLLSNLMLDVVDKELERRGHRFVRYADDSNIYVRSWRAGERVMEGVERFLAKRLKLVVNAAKSAVDRPARRSFLGFSFTPGATPKRRVAPKALTRFKERVRELTRCVKSVSIDQLIKELSSYLVGWRGYFGYCETPGVLGSVDKWIRRRIRAIVWRQWKRGRTRFKALRRLGVGKDLAAQTVGSSRGPWRISKSPALHYALPKASLARFGLVSVLPDSAA